MDDKIKSVHLNNKEVPMAIEINELKSSLDQLIQKTEDLRRFL